MAARKITFRDRIRAGYVAVADIVSKVWIYIVGGIAVGAVVHGYVPENFMASIMGKTSPAAALAVGEFSAFRKLEFRTEASCFNIKEIKTTFKKNPYSPEQRKFEPS